MIRIGAAVQCGRARLVVVGPDGTVLDEARLPLTEPGIRATPIASDAQRTWVSMVAIHDDELAVSVAVARAAARRATTWSVETFAPGVTEPVAGLSMQGWPDDFPADLTTARTYPWALDADVVMYAQVFADVAASVGWSVHRHSPDAIDAMRRQIQQEHHARGRRLGPGRAHQAALAAAHLTPLPNA